MGILIIGLIILGIIGWVWDRYDDSSDWACIFILSSSFFVPILIIASITSYIPNKYDIIVFEEEKRVIELSIENEDIDKLYNAGVISKVAELNGWLEVKQRKNKGFFDICIPDKIEKLEKIDIKVR